MSNNIFFERGQMADKPNNYLWNGDCLELMKNIPDKSIDAIICDLPYGTTRNKWDSVIPLDLLWEQYNRIIKERGAIVLFAQTPFDKVLGVSNLKMLKYEWIWEKDRPTGHLNAKKMPMKAHENILVFYKKLPTYNPQKTTGHKPMNNGSSQPIENINNYGKFNRTKTGGNTDRYPRSIYKCNTVNSQSGILHPTQKPLKLVEMLVKTYTNENDWVLDNTCGSNTTGIACYDLNRNYIGIEKDIDIYNVAKKRVEKNILLRANEPKALFDDRT